MQGEMTFYGKSITTGIGRGKAFLLKKLDLEQFRQDTRIVDLISSELALFDLAVHRSQNQISRLANNRGHDSENQSSPIFEASLALLKDPSFVAPIKETIEGTGLQGKTVLAEEIARLRDIVSQNTNDLAVKSAITLQDLYYRVLYNMLPSEEGRISSIKNMPAGSILVADRLSPVEVAAVPLDKLTGIIVEDAAQYSHAAIMASALGIPVIIDLAGIGLILKESTDVLVDAYRGCAILNPTESALKESTVGEERYTATVTNAGAADAQSTVTTTDGIQINIQCNASTLAGMKLAYSQGITGIGLFRSEMRYLATLTSLTYVEEAAWYVEVLGAEGITDITLRLLDLGGDKLPIYIQMDKEANPQLGCRGIRFLLANPTMMRRQIKAILSARCATRVKILIPFVTTLSDVIKTRQVIDEILLETNFVGSTPNLGIMIEVPSVALSLERYLPKVDFVCLGTNDLLQFFFAANRDQSVVQTYCKFTHPDFLNMLKNVITVCNNSGKHLVVCGEIASDPLGCSLLAALGATNVSIQPYAIHGVRNALAALDVASLQAALPQLLTLDSAEEVEDKLRSLGL